MLTAARWFAPRLSWRIPKSTAGTHLRCMALLPLLALIAILAHPIGAQSADQAFTQNTLSLEWSESPDQLASNLQALNTAFEAAKGARGERFATYSIRNPNLSIFELKDRERRFITEVEHTDYSHELELHLKSGTVVDYEALGSSKTLNVVIDAVAKRESDIRRLVHSSEVDEALRARNRLGTPSSLSITISVTDVDEPPVVKSAFDPDSNHQRGYLLRMNAKDRTVNFRTDRLFQDPEGLPLYFKPNSEDVEIREFSGISPNFGTHSVKIGDTDLDTNSVAGNSPFVDGRIVKVNISGSTISITPVADVRDSIRKAEVRIRGWDQRGPTEGFPSLDPATSKKVAKITVLVQTGTNRLPQWPGNATGFSIAVDEGFEGLLQPRIGTWEASDPDGDPITYELLDASPLGACSPLPTIAGITFGGACVRLESSESALLSVLGKLDYELVREDPVGRFTLLAIDSRGSIAEARIEVHVRDIDEPITGGFKTGALSIYLPTTSRKRIDLSDLFEDPEDRENLTFRATSNAPSIVTVNETPDPILEITAHRLGRTDVRVWASGTTGGTLLSSLSVIVKNDNHAPTFDVINDPYRLSIPENALIGTRLTTLITASDPDLGDVLSFNLETNSHFGLTTDGLPAKQVQLVTIAPLDYETQSQYILALTVSDDVAIANTELRISLSNTDESVQATSDPITPIYLSVDTVRTLDAKVHFVDEDGQVPEFSVGQYDSSIVDIFVRTNGEVEIFAKRNGRTDAALLATDSLGNVAAKRFSIVVEPNEPPVVSQPIPDQTMPLGLRELSMATVFSDTDGEVTIVEVTSSDEDVLWAIIPRNEPETLVLYAWRVGEAEITILARDSSGNETTHTFSVSVTEDGEVRETETLIADQVIGVGQLHGAVSLFEAFSTEEGEPDSFTVSSDRLSVVDAVTGDSDVVAWWHALSCTQKVTAVGDTGSADESNPYCQDFARLRAQHKVIVRAVAAHHILLQGIGTGSAEVTVTATYAAGTTAETTFSVTVESMVASVAASIPQRVAYLDEPLALSIRDLLSVDTPVNILKVAARESSIANVNLSVDQQSVEIEGREIGTTSVALMGVDTAGQPHAIQFSLRVANRAPQVSGVSLSLTLEVGEEPHILDLHRVFSDSQELRFALIQGGGGETDLIEASIQESNLVISPLRKGSTQLSVRATDTFGASATAVFGVTVSEDLLNEAASDALAGYSRSVLNSVSSVIGARVNAPLDAPDLRHTETQYDSNVLSKTSTYDLGWDVHTTDTMNTSMLHDSSTARGASIGGPSIPRISHKITTSDETKYWTLWTDSDTQSYHDDNHRGQTRSNYIGTDVVVNQRVQAGVAGSHVSGSGDYVFGNAQRWFDIEQTLLSPYARYQIHDDTSIWVIASVGNGLMETATRPEEKRSPSHELETSAIILGAAHELASIDRLELAWSGDIAHLSMNADALNQDRSSLSAREQRARGGLTATYSVPISSHTVLEPFVTLNLRYDRGNEAKGGGLETIAGTRLATRTFDFEIRGRQFELSGDQAYREQGWSVSTTYNPSKDSSGWSISLAPTWGSTQTAFNPFSSNPNIGSRFSPWVENVGQQTEFGAEGSLSYGIKTNRDRFIVTPYLQTRSLATKEHRLGMRVHGASQSTRSLKMDFVVQRTELSQRETDTGIVFGVTLRL